MNELPVGINTNSKPVLFAYDKSVLITDNNLNDLQIRSAFVLNCMRKWLTVNGLSLKVDKADVIKFKLNNLQNGLFQILYQDKEIKEVKNIKFL
jgi:hypothetical protein